MNDLEINNKALSIIQERLNSIGIKGSAPYQVLKDGLAAVKVSYDKYGDERIEVDYKERRETASVVLTMMGHLKPKDSDGGIQVQVQIRPGDVEKLQGIMKELEGLNKRLGEQGWQRGEVIDVIPVQRT